MTAAPAARRTNVADFRLVVDGYDIVNPLGQPQAVPPADITATVRPRLVSLRLSERRGDGADQLDIVLDDSDGAVKLPRKGAVLVLSLGWAAGEQVRVGLVDKGRFTVDQVEWGGPPDQVTIRARSADLTAGFRARRERGHRDTTLGAIAREVAGRAGLTAAIAAELDGIAIPMLAQHQQSDMALLRRLGREHDAVATVKDRRLLLTPIGRAASAGGKPLTRLTLGRADVSDYRYAEVERSAGAGVEARWHDQKTGERKTVREGGGNEGGRGDPKRLRRTYHSEAEAKAAAKAEAGRTTRAEAGFDVSLPLGRPDLVLEQPVTLTGFKPPVDARRWLIAELAHDLDAGGLRTKLKLETGGR